MPDGAFHLEEGQIFDEEFVLQKNLGRGGTGVVYLAKSISTGKHFAMKSIPREHLGDERRQRSFLKELQTLVGLPLHQHLAAYRFFRTTNNQIAIFTEFAEMGSLGTQIRDRCFTNLNQIVDACIQFAWGLEAVHELGLIHYDVKPDNALLTWNRIVKVCDFGLATAADAIQQSTGSRSRETVVYRSPEQATGRTVTYKTDIWSWAASVLAIFKGGPTWAAGEVAGHVLESYLEDGPDDPSIPMMPGSVADVLRKCLVRDPEQRWSSMADIAAAMRLAFSAATGTAYLRQIPGAPYVPHEPGRVEQLELRAAETPGSHLWLERACYAAGERPPKEPPSLRTFSSPKSQAIAELHGYQEAGRIFERLISAGRADLEPELASLFREMASVHLRAHDLTGAMDVADRGIKILERLLAIEWQPQMAMALAASYRTKATIAQARIDWQAADKLFASEIRLRERLVADHSELLAQTTALAEALLRRAQSMRLLGQSDGSAKLCDQAIKLCGATSSSARRPVAAAAIARAYLAKAAALSQMNENNGALSCYERAIECYQQLEARNTRARCEIQIALAQLDKKQIAERIARPARAPKAVADSILADDLENAGNGVRVSLGTPQTSLASFEAPVVDSIHQELSNRELLALTSIFQRIFTKDADHQVRPFTREQLERYVPKWLNRNSHEWDMLVLTLERIRLALEDGDVDALELTFMQALVVLEYVAGSGVMTDENGKPIAATQQVADAWFHKATIYIALAEGHSDTRHAREQCLQAAAHCLDRAESNRQFIQPTFTEWRAVLEHKMNENPFR